MMAIHYSNEYDYMSKETSKVWNRVRMLNRGDTIRVWRMDAAEEDRRCTSSVSYMVSIDRNRRHPARRVELEDHICYGELLNLIIIGLPHHPKSSGTLLLLSPLSISNQRYHISTVLAAMNGATIKSTRRRRSWIWSLSISWSAGFRVCQNPVPLMPD
ncbi:hypothetical protein J007_03102 [Cryptococcus neoformans]|nr:hypothetical protein J007_03102 [Cryptococcus neoformans var. grubii]OXC61418.1 hypothetical protein C358_03186 [Cryptococcus neoformans var. grubii MW-RSA852]